jgi:hypothetical protein
MCHENSLKGWYKKFRGEPSALFVFTEGDPMESAYRTAMEALSAGLEASVGILFPENTRKPPKEDQAKPEKPKK